MSPDGGDAEQAQPVSEGNLDAAGAYTSAAAESQFSMVASARHHSHKQQLGLAGLACLIFLEVAGGPFGTEDAVKAAGPRYALLGFLILPFVWSIPEALVCAELATAFPENSGYVIWVESAFGPFWGFLEGLFSWVSGVTDNTLYPIMLLSYMELFIPSLSHWLVNKLALIASSAAMIALNYSGLDIVGKASEVIVCMIIIPFIFMAILGIPKLKVSNWSNTKPLKDINWISYANTMFWNLNSWDSVSTLAGEVRNPSRIFPTALIIAVQLVIGMYLFPLLIGIGVTDNVYGDWQVGYFGHVAEIVGGTGLAAMVTLAAAVSQVGMFEAEMSSDSYQVLGMAERGYLPMVFARRSRFGTPQVGILLSSMGILMMLFFSFMEIIEMLNVVYCLAELLEFAAFLWLRVSQPNLRRGYRVPLPVWALTLMLLPASVLLATVFLLPFIMGQWKVVVFTSSVALLGVSMYAALQLLRRSGALAFEHSDSLAADCWRPGSLSLSLLALPTFLFGLWLRCILPEYSVYLVSAIALSSGIVASVLLVPVLHVVLRNDARGSYLINSRTVSGGANLECIPEGSAARTEHAPLMRAFLQDSLCSVEERKSLETLSVCSQGNCDDAALGPQEVCVETDGLDDAGLKDL